MKALIIGSGVAAQMHCEVLKQYHINIAGIYSRTLASSEALAHTYKTNAYSNLSEALAQDIDFAVICTPNGTHAALAIQVMQAGKHVVVEKPLALTREDCAAVLQAAKETRRICAPISQMRFSDAYTNAKSCLEEKLLGIPVMASLSMKYYRSPEYYTGTWKGTKAMDGGELMNQGIHGIDVMCGLLGKPVSVSGKIATRCHNIEAEDTAVAQLTFPGGILGVIDSSTAVSKSKPRRLEICGSSGLLVMEEDRIILAEGFTCPTHEAGVYRGNRDPKDIGLELHGRNYRNILAAFAGTAPLAYTASMAADTIDVICAIYESSLSGRTVFL